MIEVAMRAFRQLTRETASSLRSLGVGGYVLLGALGVLLMAAVAVAWLGWQSAPDTDVPSVGYLTLAMGVGFSLIVGAGLMGLVFYSSRSGYDEPARLIERGSQETAPDRDRNRSLSAARTVSPTALANHGDE